MSGKGIEVNGVRKSVAAWAKSIGVSPSVIYTRLHRGWPAKKAVTLPDQTHVAKGLGTDNPNYRHGATVGGIAKEYYIWADMLSRCNTKTSRRFKNYGGRGISVCEEWKHSFKAWSDYIGPRPTPRHSQDRINNDGNYEPGNVRWATPEEQATNKRNTRYITAQGRTQTLSQWASALGCPPSSLHWRLSQGWSAGEAVSTPFMRGKK